MLSLISQLTSPTLTGTDKSRSVHIENYSFPVTPNSMIKDYHLISALTRPRHQIINIYHGIMVVNENKSVINMKHVSLSLHVSSAGCQRSERDGEL